MELNINIINTIAGLIGCFIIAYIAFQIYKKQAFKPKIWKLLVIIIVGLFSFSVRFNLLNEHINIAILPLGVWVLYYVFRNKEEHWQKYRPYAWLGFGTNFILLAFYLLAIPTHHLIYPKEDLTTYISDLQNASIIYTHPSADNYTLNKEKLHEQLKLMKQDKIFSIDWYTDTQMDTDTYYKKEKFPYQLIGTLSKWGSGINSTIFIEDDGKGILMTTADKQLYFRSEESILEEVQLNEE